VSGQLRLLVAVAAALAGAAVLAGVALADAAYHSERVELRALAGAPGGGAVVNIHTDGPRVYAREVYTLRHAAPGNYVVLLNVFPTSTDCSGDGFSVATALLETNGAGNGQASFTFTPDLVDAFRGLTFGISWTLIGPAAYASDCVVVTLD
jgi:hypothetical protein